MLFADGLDHFDRRDGVICSLDVAVILKTQIETVRARMLFKPRLRIGELLGGQRDAGNVRATDYRTLGQSAPSTSDFEQPVAGLDI